MRSDYTLSEIKAKVLIERVCQFLVIIHKDFSVDLYIPVEVEIRAKRNVQKVRRFTFLGT